MSVITAVQSAVHDVIVAAVAPVVVVDSWDIGQTPDAPYVALAVTGLKPDDDKTRAAFVVTLAVHVWPDGGDRDPVNTLSEQIRAVLHRRPLTVSGYDVIDVVLEEMAASDKPDEARQMVSHYRIRVTPAA